MIELKVKCQEHGEIMRAYVKNATIWIDPKSCSYCYDKAKEGQPPEEVPPPLISEAQRKRFYAIAKGSGKSDAEIKSFLQANIGSESTGDIQKGVYEYLCNEVGKAEAV